jgi:chloride channel protein, CIC family
LNTEHRPLSPLFRRLLRLKVWLVERFRISERQSTLLWAVFIGLCGALLSEGFRKLSNLLQGLATGSDRGVVLAFKHIPWWQCLLVPTLGGVVAGMILWIGKRMLTHNTEKSTTDYMEAVVVGNGALSIRASLVKIGSALFSISSGASIGREGPLVQLSSLFASLVGSYRNLPVPQRRHLVACGAAAGIASAYNAPIAGAFFVAEIVLGTIVVESLGPIILSSVVATFATRAMNGEGALYQSPDLSLHTRWEVLPIIGMAVILGFSAPLYIRLLRIAEQAFSKISLPPPVKLAIGGAIVGFLAIYYPEICGNGQDLLRSLFHQPWFWDYILALIVLKFLATAVTFGSGAVGGVFTPTLFLGSAMGMVYGYAILIWFPELQPDPKIYGLLAMGCFLAATTGAPLMAILMVFELTLSYSLVPYLMVANVIAYYCSSIFEKRFLYGESLTRKGSEFFTHQLAEISLFDLIRKNPLTLPKSATFAQIAAAFVQHRYQHVYIIDAEEKLLGAVSLHDVKAFLDRPELETVVIAADIMNEDFPRLTPLESMNEALRKFSEAQAERLPVVDNLNAQRLIGSISKTDLILHLAGTEGRELKVMPTSR